MVEKRAIVELELVLRREAAREVPEWGRIRAEYPEVSRATFYRKRAEAICKHKTGGPPVGGWRSEAELMQFIDEQFTMYACEPEEVLTQIHGLLAHAQRMIDASFAEGGALKAPSLLERGVKLQLQILKERQKTLNLVSARSEVKTLLVTLGPVLRRETHASAVLSEKSLMNLANALKVELKLTGK